MLPLATVLFGSGAAIFYVAATPIAKALGSSPYIVFVPIVIATLVVSNWLENAAIRPARLGMLVAVALAAEIAVALILATALSPDASAREIFGVFAAFAGLALIGTRSGRTN